MVTAPDYTPTPIDVGVEQFLHRMDLRVGANLSPRTYDAYVYDLNELLRITETLLPAGVDTILDTVTAEQIDMIVRTYERTPDQRYSVTVAPRQGRGYSATIRFRNTLSKFFSTADRLQWIHANPFPDTEYAPAKPATGLQPHRKALDTSTAGKLLGSTEGSSDRKGGAAKTSLVARDQALLQLLFESGPRVSELCAFNIGDIRETIAANGAVARFITVRHGKGGKTRDLPLSPQTWDVLEAWIRDERATLISKYPQGDDQALFLSWRGQRISPRDVQRRVAKLSKVRAGIHVTPHAGRHTAATHLLQGKEGRLPAVQHVLGHADISTTGLYLDSNDWEAYDAVSTNPITTQEGEGEG